MLCVTGTQTVDRRYIPFIPRYISTLGSFGTPEQRNRRSLGYLWKISTENPEWDIVNRLILMLQQLGLSIQNFTSLFVYTEETLKDTVLYVNVKISSLTGTLRSGTKSLNFYPEEV